MHVQVAIMDTDTLHSYTCACMCVTFIRSQMYIGSNGISFISGPQSENSSSVCSCIGENITSLLAEEISLSVDPKLTSDDPLLEDTLLTDDNTLLSELRLPGADDNEERTPVNKALMAET